MLIKKIILTILICTSLATQASDDQCRSEYERGKRETEFYAHLVGLIKGVIYAYSQALPSEKICMLGTPEEKVEAIAMVLKSKSFEDSSISLLFVPTKEASIKFLERFFPCENTKNDYESYNKL